MAEPKPFTEGNIEKLIKAGREKIKKILNAGQSMRNKHGFAVYNPNLEVLKGDEIYELISRYGKDIVMDVVAFNTENDKVVLYNKYLGVVVSTKLDTQIIQNKAIRSVEGISSWTWTELVKVRFKQSRYNKEMDLVVVYEQGFGFDYEYDIRSKFSIIEKRYANIDWLKYAKTQGLFILTQPTNQIEPCF